MMPINRRRTDREYTVPTKPTNDDIVAMVYHTDGRVNAIESKIDSQGDQLNRIESSILNKQPAWNNGSVMGLVIAVGAFLVGITGYVSLQLSPITDRLVADVGWQESLDQYRMTDLYAQGQTTMWMKEHEVAYNHHDELYHKLVDQVAELQERAAAAEVARKATGDYAKENRMLMEQEL